MSNKLVGMRYAAAIALILVAALLGWVRGGRSVATLPAPVLSPRQAASTVVSSETSALANAASVSPPPSPSSPKAAPPTALPTYEGGVVARSLDGRRLYIADEDHQLLRLVPLPLVGGEHTEIAMPGPPASVLVLAERVLVTIRQPGLLLVMRATASGLVEEARVALPDDAWGLATTPDQRTALVTSAWSHRVSAVDIATAKVRWQLDVAREPRGVLIMRDGATAYLSHLVGSALTRIDNIVGEALVTRVPLPAAPLRSKAGEPTRAAAASLGYALVASPDYRMIYAPRRALGAYGQKAWAGQPTVDVMLTATEQPLAQRNTAQVLYAEGAAKLKGESGITGPGPLQVSPPFLQPRAAVYRKKRHQLLIASEGTDQLSVLEAGSIDPSASADFGYDLNCGAPSGIALSADEDVAYVFCRSSFELARVEFDDIRRVNAGGFPIKKSVRKVRLAKDPLDRVAASGRRLFYRGDITALADNFACAGCHPDGRDDGHVWQDRKNGYIAFPTTFVNERLTGEKRQTPMLAGRIAERGPYGWRGKDRSLPLRVLVGFGKHRWFGSSPRSMAQLGKAKALAAFLRQGLRPPPTPAGALSAAATRGKAIFEDPEVGCASCHLPKQEYSNQSVVTLAITKDNQQGFRTPSLQFVSGTPPYYHDGSAETLRQLVDEIGDRMGFTSHLNDGDRAALVAFLETL